MMQVQKITTEVFSVHCDFCERSCYEDGITPKEAVDLAYKEGYVTGYVGHHRDSASIDLAACPSCKSKTLAELLSDD